MISEEQYQDAIRVIEQYEYEQKAEHEPPDEDDGEDYNDDGDEYDDRHHCSCGAWGYGPKGFFCVADCICGHG